MRGDGAISGDLQWKYIHTWMAPFCLFELVRDDPNFCPPGESSVGYVYPRFDLTSETPVLNRLKTCARLVRSERRLSPKRLQLAPCTLLTRDTNYVFDLDEFGSGSRHGYVIERQTSDTSRDERYANGLRAKVVFSRNNSVLK